MTWNLKLKCIEAQFFLTKLLLIEYKELNNYLGLSETITQTRASVVKSRAGLSIRRIRQLPRGPEHATRRKTFHRMIFF